MAKSQTAVLARAEAETRPAPQVQPPDAPAPASNRGERKPAERIRDALLQWLEEEA